MAEVTKQNRKQKQYVVMTENNFKARYNMHKQSFNNPKHEILVLPGLRFKGFCPGIWTIIWFFSFSLSVPLSKINT